MFIWLQLELIAKTIHGLTCSPRASTPKTNEMEDYGEDIVESSARAAGLHQGYTPQLSPVPDNNDVIAGSIRYGTDHGVEQSCHPTVSEASALQQQQQQHTGMSKITVIQKPESAETKAALVNTLSQLPRPQQEQFLAGGSLLYQQYSHGAQTTCYQQPTSVMRLPTVPEAMMEPPLPDAPNMQEHSLTAQEPDSTTCTENAAIRLPPIETLASHPHQAFSMQERESGSSDLSDVDENVMPALVVNPTPHVADAQDDVDDDVEEEAMDPVSLDNAATHQQQQLQQQQQQCLRFVGQTEATDTAAAEELRDDEDAVSIPEASDKDARGSNVLLPISAESDDDNNSPTAAACVVRQESTSSAAAVVKDKETDDGSDVEEVITVYASDENFKGKKVGKKTTASRKSDEITVTRVTRAKRQQQSGPKPPQKKVRKRSK